MAITGSWVVWLAGSDTYVTADANSEIALASMPLALQTVSSPNWTPVTIISLKPEYAPWGNDSRAQARIFELHTGIVAFPDDMAELEAIDAILRSRYLYFCMDGSGQDAETIYPERVHTAGKCLSIVDEKNYSMNHNNEYSSKNKTYKIRKRKPVF